MGHFPFSHASEHLLPAGWDHERMSRALIFSEEMQDIWQKGMDAPMRAEEIADLAVGPDPDSPEAFPAGRPCSRRSSPATSSESTAWTICCETRITQVSPTAASIITG
ncbi:MAG: hypothetical protein M3R46_07785 [Actinomycetota bacterium]|nr:hypothetical protein [Actinomycetota bacterium]MDQ3276037.1 hypothetical protein [Actinomycetota bacterium]